MKKTLELISLGAGVQSSAMAIMAARGELTPMPDAAIFADTHGEPKAVYSYLEWIETQVPFPVLRVSAGSLEEATLKVHTHAESERRYTRNYIPAYTRGEDGKKGMLLRSCTRDFKLRPIKAEQKRLMKEAGAEGCRVWIGITTDEAIRMKPSGVKWSENIWPLIDMRWSRHDCEAYFERHGFPKPPKSACTYCPYHSDFQWRELRDNDPKGFAAAVEFEKKWNAAIRKDKRPAQLRGEVFLHRSAVPLDQADFSSDFERGQLSLFGNDCEGMCGL